MVYLYASLLTLLNLVLWVSILFNLPGTWLMILLAVILEWWLPEQMFSWELLYFVTGLAVLGELLEFTLGATGSRRAGGSKRAAGLAILCGILGAIVGTALPVPILGTLLGACAGAFLGSLLGDIWAGRTIAVSFAAGQAAAVGRLWGTMAKMALGGLIVLALAVSAFV